MASPFHHFRRHQKVLLAVSGIAAMIAFVFVNPLGGRLGGSGERANPVVVETRLYGDLHESDLVNIIADRKLVGSFIEQLVFASVVQDPTFAQQPPARIQPFIMQKTDYFLRIMDRSKGTDEENAVETYVMAKKAEENGITVSDNSVKSYLNQIIGDSLTSQQVAEVIASMRPRDSAVSETQLVNALRQELLANEYIRLFQLDLQPIPPGQRWDYFLRMNRRASIEALALPVANFLAEAPEPSDQDLQKLYLAHRDQLPDPTSPEPGFKSPKKVAVQYFKAEREAFIKRAEAEVTEQQIAEYYEKHKDQMFRKKALPPEPPAEKSPTTETPAAPPADSPAATPPANTPPTATPPAGAPTSDPPATPPAASPATPPPAAPAPSAPAKPAPGKSSQYGGVKFLLVADEKPAEAAASAEKPAATPAVSAPDAKSPDATPAEPTPPAAVPPVEHEPLDNVKDTIRLTLAREVAANKVNTAMDDLLVEMTRYSEDRLVGPEDKAEDEPADGAKPAKERTAKGPKPLDFPALAEKFGVLAKDSPLLTAEEFRNEDIGRSFKMGARGGRPLDFISLVFSDTLQRYSPDQTTDAPNNQYLFWKTEQDPEHVPAFDKVRPEVLRAWKLIAARKIALEKAEQYLSEARTKKESLEAAFGAQPTLRVLKPAAFTWMMSNFVTPRERANQPLRLSEVEGVEAPGSDFMSSVFKLEPGDYGIALNHPKNTVYVVRLLEYDRSLDSLRDQFATEPFSQYERTAQPDQRHIFFDWVEGVMKDAGVQWLRAPLQPRQR